MPHSQIVFVKVKMELFEDYRFLFDLNDNQKLLYLLLLGLAGKTNNKIKDDIEFIKTRMNIKDLNKNDLRHISSVFPKFKLVDGYWEFENFEEHHNWYSKSSAKVVRKYSQNKNKKENKNKNIYIGAPTLEDCMTYFKELGHPLEANKFFDYYEAQGWVRKGGVRIASWKACARMWVSKSKEFNSQTEEKSNFNDLMERLKTR